MDPVSPFENHSSEIIFEPEQTTPDIEQHAVEFVDETYVVFPISCQLRTTQQHSGEVE